MTTYKIYKISANSSGRYLYKYLLRRWTFLWNDGFVLGLVTSLCRHVLCRTLSDHWQRAMNDLEVKTPARRMQGMEKESNDSDKQTRFAAALGFVCLSFDNNWYRSVIEYFLKHSTLWMDLCLCSGEQRSRFTALSAGVTGNSRRAFVKTHPPKYSIGIPSASNVWSKIRKPPWASDFFRQFLRVIFKSNLGILFNNLHESHRTISKHFNMNLIGTPRMIFTLMVCLSTVSSSWRRVKPRLPQTLVRLIVNWPTADL